MVESIKTVLMRRDGIGEEEAEQLVSEAKSDLSQRLMDGENIDDIYNICSDWFGLEPDYLEELLPF